MKITLKQLRKILNESLSLSFKPQATQEEKDQMKHTLSNILNTSDIDMYHHHEENEYHSHFVNELGNDIEIEIKDFECGSANQLTISIIGPNSETENTITRMEAVELHRLLGDYLLYANASLE